MPTDVIMPALGMAQDTGVVVSWKKQPGDEVIKGEPLLEVETDKAIVDVEAPATGTLASISAEAGAEVPIGTTIAVILAPGEKSSLSPSAERARERGEAEEPSLSPSGERARERGEEEEGEEPSLSPSGERGRER